MTQKDTKSYCETCDFETNHSILHIESVDGNEDYHCVTNFMLVKYTISFRKAFIDFENAYPNENNDWEPEITITTYPKQTIQQQISNVWILPDKIRTAYMEALNAFNSECFLLSGVGFRAVIEAICLDKNVQGRDLAKKIDNLTKQKLITEKEAERLHSVRFLGNDSVHEMSVPEKSKLLIVLNIIVHLLNNLYIIDYEIKNKLETVIAFYPEFELLLNVSLKNINQKEEVPIAKILGKSIRRLNGKIQDFENELIAKIKSGEYSKLEIGKIDKYGSNTNLVQHFIKK